MAASDAAASAAGLRRGRTGIGGRPVGELAFQALLLFSLLVALVILFVLIADVVVRGGQVFADRPTEFLTRGVSGTASRAGVWQGIVGSLSIVVVVALVAFPIGIATAIYLEEYAPDTRLTRFIDVNIRNLAGVPSVVYGLLGLALFVNLLGDRRGSLVNLTGGSSILTGGLTLALLVLPIVIITSAESIRSVPQSLRQGGFGLGGTRWQVTRRLTLPSAMPGILTGTILALSRAIGETAPLIVIGAISGFFATNPANPVEFVQGPFTALPMVVFTWARQPGNDFQDVLAPAAIIVLLVFTLSANGLAIWLRNRYDSNR